MDGPRSLRTIVGWGVEHIAGRRGVKVSIRAPSFHLNLVVAVLKQPGRLSTPKEAVPRGARDPHMGGSPLGIFRRKEDHRPQGRGEGS